MVQSKGTINFLQACLMFLLMNGLSNHVIVNPMLLDASGRDAWVAVLATGVPFLLWSAMLVWFMKRSRQQKLLPWLSSKTHPVVGWLLVAPLGLQLYLIGGMTTIHTTTWTISNYLPLTPKLVLAIALTSICVLPVLSGLRAIAIIAAFLLPLVVVLGYFVSFANMPQKDFTLLGPVAEHGLGPVWAGMIYAGGGFVEIAALLAMQHRIKANVKMWSMLLYCILSVYIMLGPVIGAITEFGPKEAALQMESPYEQWRLVKIGNYIEHIDFFSIFQWLSGACIRISLSVYLLLELFDVHRKGVRIGIGLGAIGSYVIAGMYQVNEYSFYIWMYEWYFPISLSIMLAVSACWLIVALFSKKQRQVRT